MADNTVFPYVISGLSLLASVTSIIVAAKAHAKANTLNRERNVLALRQARASEHAVFVQGLFTVKQRLQDLLPEFRNEAEKTYSSIAHMLDSYDTRRGHGRALSHIYILFCDLIYAALSSQLVWSTHIHYRLPAIWRDIGYDRKNNRELVQMLNSIMYHNSFPYESGLFKWLHRRPHVKAEMLAKGIHEMYERIDEKQEIFIEAYNRCQKYFEI